MKRTFLVTHASVTFLPIAYTFLSEQQTMTEAADILKTLNFPEKL
jgi:hypothetical protein